MTTLTKEMSVHFCCQAFLDFGHGTSLFPASLLNPGEPMAERKCMDTLGCSDCEVTASMEWFVYERPLLGIY